jgi:uncharacterized protein YjbI with pentapeptide repeats
MELIENGNYRQLDISHSVYPPTTFLNCNFSGANLKSINMAGSKFINCNFSYAIMLYGNFSQCSFSHCDFKFAKCLFTNFKDSRFSNVKMHGAWLECTIFENTTGICTTLQEQAYAAYILRQYEDPRHDVVDTMYIHQCLDLVPGIIYPTLSMYGYYTIGDSLEILKDISTGAESILCSRFRS